MKRDLISTCTYKYFEIFNAVYVKNAWYVPLLRNSPQICSYTMEVPFNDLLAEFPVILDNFLPIPQVITYGWLIRGGGESRQWWTKHTSSSHPSKWAHLCSRNHPKWSNQWTTSLTSRVEIYRQVAFH